MVIFVALSLFLLTSDGSLSLPWAKPIRMVRPGNGASIYSVMRTSLFLHRNKQRSIVFTIRVLLLEWISFVSLYDAVTTIVNIYMYIYIVRVGQLAMALQNATLWSRRRYMYSCCFYAWSIDDKETNSLRDQTTNTHIYFGIHAVNNEKVYDGWLLTQKRRLHQQQFQLMRLRVHLWGCPSKRLCWGRG